MIAEASERALAFTEKKEMLVVGGVAADKSPEKDTSFPRTEYGSCTYLEDFDASFSTRLLYLQ